MDLSRVVFDIFDIKNTASLKSRSRVTHSRWSKLVPFDRLVMISRVL